MKTGVLSGAGVAAGIVFLGLAAGAGSAEEAAGSQVDAIFADLTENRTPGCSVGVVQNDVLVHAKGYGYANLEYDIPLTADSVFRTGSVSKQFTAAAVALAAEEGLLDLDAPIGTYMPELHPDVHPVTVRQVVGHIAGLPDYTDDQDDGALPNLLKNAMGEAFRFGNEDYLTTKEFLQVTTGVRPILPAGEQFRYSNIGYFWLAQLVERVSGVSIREYAQSRLFDAAEMNKSYFYDDVNGIVPLRATGYSPLPDGGFEIYETNLDWVGDGGVYTSVRDFHKWDLQHNKPTIGKNPESLYQLLTTPIVHYDSGDEKAAYAFGLRIGHTPSGEPVLGHSGSWVAFRAFYKRFPERDFAYFIFCNRPDLDLDARAAALEAVYLD